MKRALKLHWFVPSLMGILCLTAPAKAGQLTTWRYDSSQNRLEFATDEDVQPRAQLVFDPTRLVIDLPGTRLGQAPVTQPMSGAIQQMRIGQFDEQTTRIVVELAPGYTIDPQQVRFRGVSPTEWTVQLPQATAITPETPSSSPSASEPQSAVPSPRSASQAGQAAPTSLSTTSRASAIRSAANSTAQPSAQSISITRSSTSTSASTPASSERYRITSRSSRRRSATRSTPEATQISNVQITDEGLFVSTEGDEPKVSIQRSRSGRSITIRLEKAALSPQFRDRKRQVERYGVNDLAIDQDDDAVEIKLDVARRSPNWQAQTSEGGILLLPETQVAQKTATATDPEPPVQPPAARSVPSTIPSTIPATVAEQPSPARQPANNPIPTAQLATIQGLDLSGNQLLIRTDRPVSHRAQWQGGMYVLTLSPARLAGRVTGPQLTATDPLQRVRLRQVDQQTVTVAIQPTAGVQFGALNLITPQTLALEMQRSTAAVPNPRSPNPTNQPLPRVIPNGQVTVAIDPGHGGNDVGAVGIDSIREANVVLPIAQQVAALLQQQGIQAVLTRSGDVEIDLEPRVQMAEQLRANLFVSIHANSMGMDRPDVNGTETYFYSNGGALAEVIQNGIVSSLGVQDRGVRQARFYVLRETTMPAVLVETGYVTGNEDASRLANINYQKQMATAIARGILQYIQQQAMVGGR